MRCLYCREDSSTKPCSANSWDESRPHWLLTRSLHLNLMLISPSIQSWAVTRILRPVQARANELNKEQQQEFGKKNHLFSMKRTTVENTNTLTLPHTVIPPKRSIIRELSPLRMGVSPPQVLSVYFSRKEHNEHTPPLKH